MDASTMTLDTELRYFDEHRHAWIREGHEDEWCVIRGRELLGFFDSLSEAYEAGVERFGEGVVFLVKQIRPEDPTATIHRVSWANNDEWPV